MHKIDADLFNQDLYLINNVEIDIEVAPNQNINYLLIMTTGDLTNYVSEIISCKLFVKRLTLLMRMLFFKILEAFSIKTFPRYCAVCKHSLLDMEYENFRK